MSITVGALRKIDQKIKIDFANKGIDIVDQEAQEFHYSAAPDIFNTIGADDAILFTSQHAIHALTANTDIPKHIENTATFVIAGKTRELAEKYNFYIKETAASAQALAQKIAAFAPTNVYHFCAEDRLHTAEQVLNDANINYLPVIVYSKKAKTISLPLNLDAMVFFSPSQVDIFQNSSRQTTAVAFCIGATTAAHFSAKYPSTKVVVAQTPSTQALFTEIENYYKSYVK